MMKYQLGLIIIAFAMTGCATSQTNTSASTSEQPKASHTETAPMNATVIPSFGTDEMQSMNDHEGQTDAQLPPMASGLRTIDLTLNPTTYTVVDTAEYTTFRLYINNPTDSLVVIDHVEPSCGCIMTTVQKSYARNGKPAEIYIAIKTSMMNDIQPYTVDIKTNVPTPEPLRLTIQKERK